MISPEYLLGELSGVELRQCAEVIIAAKKVGDGRQLVPNDVVPENA